jgi:prepilin signal peptidase PulO-like enzyme (type II secretory pathway)
MATLWIVVAIGAVLGIAGLALLVFVAFKIGEEEEEYKLKLIERGVQRALDEREARQ